MIREELETGFVWVFSTKSYKELDIEQATTEPLNKV